MTDKTIIDWEKEFDKFVLNPKHWSDEIPSHLYLADIKSFIRKQLTLAEKRGEEKGHEKERKFIGKNKRVWFNKGVKEGEEKAREAINARSKYVESNPKILSGSLVFKRTRLRLDTILIYIAHGYSMEDLKEAYPTFLDSLKQSKDKEVKKYENK